MKARRAAWTSGAIGVRILFALLFSVCLLMQACSGRVQSSSSNETAAQLEKGDKKKKGEKDNNETPPAKIDTATASGKCDKSLWQHVYNPERLEVQKECTTVTGTITERDTDADGDEHMLLKLDAGQEDLLTKKNKKKKDDQLVIEAVCAGQPTLDKVGDACNNFENQVPLPNVGDHVRVTGSLVLDTHNGWNEIHPITSVQSY